MMAKGIPERRTHEIADLKDPAVWRFVLQSHPAARSGQHTDLRIADPRVGYAHSWATKKPLPGPGDPPIAVYRQPTHTIKYLDFTGELKSGYGRTKPGQKVEKVFDQPIEVLEASKGSIRFNTYVGKNTSEYLLTAKNKDPNTWYLLNVTKTRYPGVDLTKPKVVRERSAGIPDDERWMQAKIDGAHNLVVLRAGHRPRVLSHRPSKASGGVIDHTFKFHDLMTWKTPKDLGETVLRAEVYAMGKDRKAIPAERIAGLLNANVWKSREDQRSLGALRLALLDIDTLKGRDVRGLPYPERLQILEGLKKRIPSTDIPEIARTLAEKKNLYEMIRSGKHPQTSEGVIMRGDGRPSKIKFINDFDVYARSLSKVVGKAGERDEAGSIGYSRTPGGNVLGAVGTGLSQQQREDIFKNWKDFEGKRMRVHAVKAYRSGALEKPVFKGWMDS